jgi:alkanesulfonate monooxygenase SsuD/methylene tetrahydromethanopterin reductase-like flavin-dependent oxidoreductase (luciferase family)
MDESAALLRSMLAGGKVNAAGRHYRITDHKVRPAGRPAVRLLVGGNGSRVLQAAGRLGDAIGFTGFSPSADGSRPNISHFTEDGLAERIAVARSAAAERWPLPIDLLVQAVVVTNRPEPAIERLASRFGLPVEQVRTSPFALIGSTAAIAARLGELRERFGVTSVTVFAHRPESDQTERTMAPVIEALG